MSGFWKILGEKEHKPNPRRKKKKGFKTNTCVSYPFDFYFYFLIPFLNTAKNKFRKKKIMRDFPI